MRAHLRSHSLCLRRRRCPPGAATAFARGGVKRLRRGSFGAWRGGRRQGPPLAVRAGDGSGRRRMRTRAAAANDADMKARSTHEDKAGGRPPTRTSVAAAAAHASDWRWPRRRPPHDAQAGGRSILAHNFSAAGVRTSSPAAIGRSWRRHRPPPDAYKSGGRQRCRHQCALDTRTQGQRPPADMHKCGGGRRARLRSAVGASHTKTRTTASCRHARVWRLPPRTFLIGGGLGGSLLMMHKRAAAAAGPAFRRRQAHVRVRPPPSGGAGVGGGRRRTCTRAAAADKVVIYACSAHNGKDGGRQPTCTSVH